MKDEEPAFESVSEAEALFAELMATPPAERSQRLHEEKFHNRALFELVLGSAQAALPCHLSEAKQLIRLTTNLAMALRVFGQFDDETDHEVLSHVMCLAATAHRLLGEVEMAEATFERAGSLTVDSAAGRGFYCRALGLLRWDQGRIEEAAALLHHAHRRFAEAENVREELACCALIGMLHILDGKTAGAVPFFERACPDLESGGRPWLTAQSWLGLAFCFAAAGLPNKALAARQAAWNFYREVQDEEMQLALHWLEGRGAILAGDADDGEHLLQAVRRRWTERWYLPEATLATVDLAWAWSRSGRQSEVKALVEELRTSFHGERGLETALAFLAAVPADGGAGQSNSAPWATIGPAVRMAFRSRGVPMRPVAFA